MQSDRSQPLISNDAENSYPMLNQSPRVNVYQNQPISSQQPILLNQPIPTQQQLYVNQPPRNQVYGNPNLQNQGWNNQPIQNQGWNNQIPQNQGLNIQNQGFPGPNQIPYRPNNQGFHPNLPQQQPYFPNGQFGNQGQMPMPNVNQNKVVIIREHSSIPCRMCGYDGMSTWRQNPGCALISWAVCLFCFTGFFCWVPFCIDSCYDTEVVCSRCAAVKNIVQADCC